MLTKAKVGDRVRRRNFGAISTGRGVVMQVFHRVPEGASEVLVRWEHGEGTYSVRRLERCKVQ